MKASSSGIYQIYFFERLKISFSETNLGPYFGKFSFVLLVKPTDYVDPYGALSHFHKIPYHLSLLGSSETL